MGHLFVITGDFAPTRRWTTANGEITAPPAFNQWSSKVYVAPTRARRSLLLDASFVARADNYESKNSARTSSPRSPQPLYIETKRGGDTFLAFAAASVHLMSFRIVHAKTHSTSPSPPTLSRSAALVRVLALMRQRRWLLSSCGFVVKHAKNCRRLIF